MYGAVRLHRIGLLLASVLAAVIVSGAAAAGNVVGAGRVQGLLSSRR